MRRGELVAACKGWTLNTAKCTLLLWDSHLNAFPRIPRLRFDMDHIPRRVRLTGLAALRAEQHKDWIAAATILIYEFSSDKLLKE